MNTRTAPARSVPALHILPTATAVGHTLIPSSLLSPASRAMAGNFRVTECAGEALRRLAVAVFEVGHVDVENPIQKPQRILNRWGFRGLRATSSI